MNETIVKQKDIRAFQFVQKAGMQGAASPLPERELSDAPWGDRPASDARGGKPLAGARGALAPSPSLPPKADKKRIGKP